MPINHLLEVERLAGLTTVYEKPSEKDWAAVEKEIGLSFPTDYKMLVTSIGEGRFGCGLQLKNPCSTFADTRLSRQALVEHREPIADLESKLEFPLYPAKHGHVLMGSIDRQMFYFKPTGGQLEGLFWLDIDMEAIRPLNYSVAQFIYNLYLGLINESWAGDMREYLWRNGAERFFTPRSKNDGL